MVTDTGSLRGHTDSTGKNSTEYRENICSVHELLAAQKSVYEISTHKWNLETIPGLESGHLRKKPRNFKPPGKTQAKKLKSFKCVGNFTQILQWCWKQ